MKGILVICREAQEWMLPWWWMHYHFHNSLPVAFIDLGISGRARSWCAKRGEVIPLLPTSLEKPQAMLLSPFDKTLLIDLDAQVCSPLNSLLELPLPPSGIALSENRTAVILFEKGAPLVKKWADSGDPELLQESGEVGLLPKKYMGRSQDPYCSEVSIVHWSGPDESSIRGAMAVCEKLLMNLTFEES